VFSVRIGVPPKRIRERFLIIYELKGCQKAVDFLTDYYRVRRMRIVLDGRRVPRKCCGVYSKYTACFTRTGLKRRVVLHEFYHHLIEAAGYKLQQKIEEKEANAFSREF
jgi:hypothetical protein